MVGSCLGIEVRADASELTDMVIARSGDRKVECSSKMKPRLRAEWVVLSKEFWILECCLVNSMSRNLVFEELRVRRLEVIQEEIC